MNRPDPRGNHKFLWCHPALQGVSGWRYTLSPGTPGSLAALREDLEGVSGARATVRLTELFDRLVRYRNRGIGHGAPGQCACGFYDRMCRSLLLGVAEILGRL